MSRGVASGPAETPSDPTEELLALRHFAGTPAEFWQAYLDAVGQVCGARRCLLLRRKADGLQALLQWPARAVGPSTDGPQAQRLAEAALATGFAVEAADGRSTTGMASRIEVPAIDAEGEPALVVLLGHDAAARINHLLPILRLATQIPGQYEALREIGRADAHIKRLLDVIGLAARLGTETRFMKAALSFSNELATRFECDRVSLGWFDGKYVRLVAVSHIEQFDRGMAAAQQLESAMEEAFDQDEEIVFPFPPGNKTVTRAHELYARTQGVGHLLSVPIRVGEEAEAVIMAERRSDGFTVSEVWETRLICDAAAARLAELHHQDRWIGLRLASAARMRLDALWGPGHSLAKLTVVTAMSVLLGLAIVQWDYRIEAAFALRSEDLVFIPAPFDGYLGYVRVDIGDKVESGAPLVELDTRELILEEAMAAADMHRYAREAEKAQAGQQLADMQIALARKEQATARLDLIRHQLSQARIVAPIAGIVVEGELERSLGAPVRKGDLLLKVARIQDTYVELDIDQADIHEVAAGYRGEIAFVGRPDLRFPVLLERIDPVAIPKDGKNLFVARARVDGGEFAEWWRPGMGGSAKIDVGQRSLLWILTHRTVRFLQRVFWL